MTLTDDRVAPVPGQKGLLIFDWYQITPAGKIQTLAGTPMPDELKAKIPHAHRVIAEDRRKYALIAS